MLKKRVNLFPLILILLPLVYTRFSLDNDFWFIINHGRYILEKGFVFVEPFTVHENLYFSFEKWLSSIIFYKLYETFGTLGIKVFLVIIFSLILIALYKTAYYISRNRNISIILTTLFGFVFTRYFVVTRPQVFSYLLLIIEFCLTEKYAKTNSVKYLYPLPIISIVYFQLHSTMWMMFFVMLIPYLLDFECISSFLGCENTKYNKKNLLFVTIVSFFAGFINPNGPESVFYLFKSLEVTNAGIIELISPNIYEFLYLCGILVTIEIFTFLNKRTVLPLRYIYILIGTSLLGIMAVRNVSYFQIYHSIILCYMLRDYNISWLDKNKFNVLLSIVIAIGIIYGVIVAKVYETNNRGEEILDKLKESIGCTYETCGNVSVFTDFNTGSYAEWLGFKAYIDPRAEIFYKSINKKEDIMPEWREIYYNSGEYEKLEEKYDFDYWLVEKDTAMYKKIIYDEKYKIADENTKFILLTNKK